MFNSFSKNVYSGRLVFMKPILKIRLIYFLKFDILIIIIKKKSHLLKFAVTFFQAEFNFLRGDYEKQLMRLLTRKDKSGMIINNPAQSMFLFIDKNQLQVNISCH